MPLLECGFQSPLSTTQRMARNHYTVPLQLWSNEDVYLCLVTFQAVLKSEEKEQCVHIKFCVKLGKNGNRCGDF